MQYYLFCGDLCNLSDLNQFKQSLYLTVGHIILNVEARCICMRLLYLTFNGILSYMICNISLKTTDISLGKEHLEKLL